MALKKAWMKTGVWPHPYTRVELENRLRLNIENGSELYSQLRRLKGRKPPAPGSWITWSDLDPTTRIYLGQIVSELLPVVPPSNQADPVKGESPPAVSRTHPVWKTSQN